MSAVINGLLNSTLGLLCTKLRDYTADRLLEGDINNDQLRQIVVRELDDIKTKLDGLSRKDLLASLSFFKEGVTRLYSSFEICGEASERPHFSKAQAKAGVREVKRGTKTKTGQFPLLKQTEYGALESAFELSEAIGNLKLESRERYKLAKESLKEAKRLATEAFNNVALSTEDRLTASKLRIASRILEGFEDPDAAVRDCLLYLTELQELPAVQAMFTVWRASDKGVTSRLRARFNWKKRTVHIKSIQMINRSLINFIIKFTNIKIGLLNWPTVKIGPFAACYHPLLDDYALQRELSKQEDKKLPWFEKFSETNLYTRHAVLTSNGEILSMGWTAKERNKIFTRKRSGVYKLFRRIPAEIKFEKICCLASDAAGNVYLLAETVSESLDLELFMFDANGQETMRRRTEISTEYYHDSIQMTVSSDGTMMVLFSSITKTMYIYDSTNTKQDHQFLLPLQCQDDEISSLTTQGAVKRYSCDEVYYRLTITNNNDIILGATEFRGDKLFIFVLTMDGQLKRRVEVPAMLTSGAWCDFTVAFNHVNETIILSCYEDRAGKNDWENSFGSDLDNEEIIIYGEIEETIEVKPSTIIQRNHTMVLILSSNASEFLHVFHVAGSYRLLSHPNGPIVLATSSNAIILQT